MSWGGAHAESVGSGAVNAPEHELRKDRPFSSGDSPWRVYLDNYDLLEKVQATDMVQLEGTCPPGILALRQEYEVWGVRRNEKKAVERSTRCELQGATVDGELRVAFPRESKIGKYFGLALSSSTLPFARQKQWQVACGGLVYFSMFRRPLLGSLNRVWSHIESFNHFKSPNLASPVECKLELLRFLALLPLGRMDFRLDMHSVVTCSDASTQGGGICASMGLTPVGEMVSQGALRGDVPEVRGEFSVFCVGLFDGISALRVALDLLGVQVLGHVSVDKHVPAQRVVESHYPGTIFVDDVAMVDKNMVLEWATRFSQAAVVLVGAGPPCQGVSGLNCDRRGALLVTALETNHSCVMQVTSPGVGDLGFTGLPGRSQSQRTTSGDTMSPLSWSYSLDGSRLIPGDLFLLSQPAGLAQSPVGNQPAFKPARETCTGCLLISTGWTIAW